MSSLSRAEALVDQLLIRRQVLHLATAGQLTHVGPRILLEVASRDHPGGSHASNRAVPAHGQRTQQRRNNLSNLQDQTEQARVVAKAYASAGVEDVPRNNRPSQRRLRRVAQVLDLEVLRELHQLVVNALKRVACHRPRHLSEEGLPSNRIGVHLDVSSAAVRQGIRDVAQRRDRIRSRRRDTRHELRA